MNMYCAFPFVPFFSTMAWLGASCHAHAQATNRMTLLPPHAPCVCAVPCALHPSGCNRPEPASAATTHGCAGTAAAAASTGLAYPGADSAGGRGPLGPREAGAKQHRPDSSSQRGAHGQPRPAPEQRPRPSCHAPACRGWFEAARAAAVVLGSAAGASAAVRRHARCRCRRPQRPQRVRRAAAGLAAGGRPGAHVLPRAHVGRHLAVALVGKR